MPLDLAQAAPATPPEAPIQPGSLSTVAVTGAQQVSPATAPVTPRRTDLDREGVVLSKWVLTIMSSFILIAMAWVFWSDLASFEQFTDLTKQNTTNTVSKEVLQTVATARTEFREFWFKTFQTVLLNVLLPVLTALLGYVFGSRKALDDQP